MTTPATPAPVYWAYYDALARDLIIHPGDYQQPNGEVPHLGTWSSVNPNSTILVEIPQEYRIAARAAFAHPGTWQSGYITNPLVIKSDAFPEFDPAKHVVPAADSFITVNHTDGTFERIHLGDLNVWDARLARSADRLNINRDMLTREEKTYQRLNETTQAIAAHLANESRRIENAAKRKEVADAMYKQWGEVAAALDTLNTLWQTMEEIEAASDLHATLTHYFPFAVDLEEQLARVLHTQEVLEDVADGRMLPPTTPGNHWDD